MTYEELGARLPGGSFRSYQPPAIKWLTKKRRGLIKCRAGGGKTIIAAAAIHQVYHSRPRATPIRIGWLANTIEQCQQAHEALDMFQVPSERHVACAAGDPDFTGVDVLVCDECHHAAQSPLWRRIIGRATKAVWGLTATPHDGIGDDPAKHAALLELFDVIHEVNAEEVAKQLAHGRVIMLDDTDPGLREVIDERIDEELAKMIRRITRGRSAGRGSKLWDDLWPRVAYRACLKLGIAENGLRNDAIVQAANQHPEATRIVLLNNKEHGGELAKRVPGAVVAHSKMRQRAKCMEALRDGSLRCIMATSILDEGFDCPRASVLIMACGGKSARAAEQRTGRVLRAFHDKQEGLIYDFTDADIHPLMRQHSLKRQEVYRSLGYTIEHAKSPQFSLL